MGLPILSGSKAIEGFLLPNDPPTLTLLLGAIEN